MKRSAVFTHSMKLTLDIMLLAFILAMVLLIGLFPRAVPQWQMHVVRFIIAAVLYAGAIWIARVLPGEAIATGVHIGAALGLCLFLFGAVADLQHVFTDQWMDATVLRWEYAITGTDLALSLQHHVSPALTEWMMFAYVVYVPLLPLVAIACWRAAGPGGAVDYMMNLALANIVCFSGFIVFPVAGPMIHYPEVFTVPLNGGIFAWCGEWMRTNVHFPGGCLPSPHCAAATVMLVMLYRYQRRLSYAILPIILTLYVSTVYGRYHYASDGVVGILVASVVLKLSPLLACTLETLVRKIKHMVRPVSAPESILE